MRPWTAELQPERTALSWSRSWLAMLCACALVARDAMVGGAVVVLVVALVAGAAWTSLALLGPGRYRRRTRALVADRPTKVMVPAVLAASGTGLLCLAALAAVVTSPR